METKSSYRLIEDETPILPQIAAESVVFDYYAEKQIEVIGEQETRQYFDLIDYLVKRANELYNINELFRKRIRRKGNEGRDNLYMFMNHWLQAKIKK